MKITLDLPEPKYDLGQVVGAGWKITTRECWIEHIYKEALPDAPKIKPDTVFENNLSMTWRYDLQHITSKVVFGYDEISLTRELERIEMLNK